MCHRIPIPTREPVVIPPRRKLSKKQRAAVFARTDGACYLCGEKILSGVPWDAEHPIPREIKAEDFDELLPAHKETCHRAKTSKQDAPTIAKTRRQAKKLGPEAELRKPSTMRSRPFPKGPTRKIQSRGFR